MKKYISNEEISNNLGSNEKIWENIFSQKEWGKYKKNGASIQVKML
nr:hypothetical protein [Campylobacter jejuni]